jgi:hypothetical protein
MLKQLEKIYKSKRLENLFDDEKKIYAYLICRDDEELSTVRSYLQPNTSSYNRYWYHPHLDMYVYPAVIGQVVRGIRYEGNRPNYIIQTAKAFNLLKELPKPGQMIGLRLFSYETLFNAHQWVTYELTQSLPTTEFYVDFEQYPVIEVFSV